MLSYVVAASSSSPVADLKFDRQFRVDDTKFYLK